MTLEVWKSTAADVTGTGERNQLMDFVTFCLIVNKSESSQ